MNPHDAIDRPTPQALDENFKRRARLNSRDAADGLLARGRAVSYREEDTPAGHINPQVPRWTHGNGRNRPWLGNGGAAVALMASTLFNDMLRGDIPYVDADEIAIELDPATQKRASYMTPKKSVASRLGALTEKLRSATPSPFTSAKTTA